LLVVKLEVLLLKVVQISRTAIVVVFLPLVMVLQLLHCQEEAEEVKEEEE
jgi:hypothetical protein